MTNARLIARILAFATCFITSFAHAETAPQSKQTTVCREVVGSQNMQLPTALDVLLNQWTPEKFVAHAERHAFGQNPPGSEKRERAEYLWARKRLDFFLSYSHHVRARVAAMVSTEGLDAETAKFEVIRIMSQFYSEVTDAATTREPLIPLSVALTPERSVYWTLQLPKDAFAAFLDREVGGEQKPLRRIIDTLFPIEQRVNPSEVDPQN